MTKYKTYKPSGVEWIGDIPSEWNLVRVKNIGKTVAGGTPSTANPDYWNGNIPWIQSGKVHNNIILFSSVDKYITEKGLNESATKLIKSNSVLIALTGATCANIGLLKFNTTANQSVVAIHNNKKINEVYLFYLMLSQREQILLEKSGGAQGGINEENVKNISLCLPSISEQTQIANFLDSKTTQIDNLIAKKEQLIKLLEEEKTAVINEAVTKGINPNVKLKDSGIEWLGKIPEHWEANSLKTITDKITDGEHLSPKTTQEGMPFLSAKDVRDGFVKLPNDRFVDYKDGLRFRERCNPKYGDILLVSRGATIGRVAMVNIKIDFCLLGSVILMKPSNKILGPFLFYSLNNRLLQDNFLLTSQSAAQQAIYLVNVVNVKIALPSKAEQIEIVDYIQTETIRIDKTIATTKKMIELLKEYRTALISEAVTGKIKVFEDKEL